MVKLLLPKLRFSLLALFKVKIFSPFNNSNEKNIHHITRTNEYVRVDFTLLHKGRSQWSNTIGTKAVFFNAYPSGRQYPAAMEVRLVDESTERSGY